MSAFSLIPWKTASGGGSGGGSGADLSEITAGAEQILAGYQSVDRNGDVVHGGIYPANVDTCFAASVCVYPGPEVLNVDLPDNGYYLKASSGGLGLWVGWSNLASAIGLTADKLKTGVTVIGVTGN